MYIPIVKSFQVHSSVGALKQNGSAANTLCSYCKSGLKRKGVFILSSLVFLFVSVSVKAQGTIKTEEVDIVKPYQPLLSDADKIDFQAEPFVADTAINALKYDVKAHLIDVPFVPAEVRAVALPEEEPQPLQNNLLKAGFGTQVSPLFDLYLNGGSSDKFDYGLNAYYLSSNGSKINYQDFSTNGISLFGTSYFEGTALSAKIGFDRHLIHYYGMNGSDSVPFSKNDLKKTYSYLPVSLSLRKTKNTKSTFDYQFNFNYHHFDGEPKLDFLATEKEDFFDFNVNLQKTFQKIHSANLLFSILNEDGKLVGMTDSTQRIISFVPYYQLHHKLGNLTAGVNISVVNKEVNFFPHVEGEYRLIGDYLIPYLGWMGEWKVNTFKSLTDINPFIGNSSPEASKVSEVFAGAKGSYGNNISYNVKLGYQTQTNNPFFLPDSLGRNYFQVLYYYKTNAIHFHAELGYRQSDRINLVLSGDANSYNLDFNDQPWGIPKSQLTFTLNYNMQDKIFTKFDLFANSGVFTMLPGDSNIIQLKGRVDANLSVTYNYKKNIAFWIALNNLFAARTSPWYNYPTYGFQAMAGLNLKF